MAVLARRPTLAHVQQHVPVQLVLYVRFLLSIDEKENDSFAAVCTPVCSNGGTCSSPGVCTCTSSWTGSRCATRMSHSSLYTIRIRSCPNMMILSFQLCVLLDVQIVELVLLQTLVHVQHHGLVPHAQQVCSDVSSFMCYR